MENFTSLSLSPSLARAIGDLGYEKPSPIQAEALPILLGKPTDFIGLAQTGTGKTAAFGIPLLEKIDPSKKAVQVIIMCPTRELVVQVAGQINLLGKYMGVQALPIYGGAGYDEQLRGLKRGAQVVVGTPGRMIDHIDRKTLKLNNIKIAILDEADEMISMGFREDMETILAATPREESNIWLFSATMSGPVRRVADEFLRSPQSVQINRKEMLSAGIVQQCLLTQEKNKPEVLCKLIDAADDFYGLIFCQTKALVVDLTSYLTERGYKADNLHGDKTQGAREVTLRNFRSRRVQILVCTDVAARGLDVKDVTHVINYSLPRELDNYVHRIGRTARSGKTGFAISLVTPMHRYLLNKIEKMTKSRFEEIQVPTRRSLGAKKVAQAMARFEDQPEFMRPAEVMDEAVRATLAGISNEEIAGRFLVMMYPEIFSDGRPGTGTAAAKREERPAPVAAAPMAAAKKKKPVVVVEDVKPEGVVEAVAEVESKVAAVAAPEAQPEIVAEASPEIEKTVEEVEVNAPVKKVAAAAKPKKKAVVSEESIYVDALDDEAVERETAKEAKEGIVRRGVAEHRKERSVRTDRYDAAERKPFKKPYGDKKPFGGKKPYGAKKAYGDKKPYGDKKTFGDKPFGAKKGFKKPFDSEKTYKPYRAPRSEEANERKAKERFEREDSYERPARPARPGTNGKPFFKPHSKPKWKAGEGKNNKKVGGNYPPRRKVLGYAKTNE